MIKIIHPKYLRAILPAILICTTLLVASCNNDSKTETKTSDSVTLKTDSTVLKDNTNMNDTTHIDTTKGEQTPPPR